MCARSSLVLPGEYHLLPRECQVLPGKFQVLPVGAGVHQQGKLGQQCS